jgi:hypothetical protein
MHIILVKKALTHQLRSEHVSDFVLKARGQEEYLVGDVPLVQFVYIQEALAKEVQPTLIVVSIQSIQREYHQGFNKIIVIFLICVSVQNWFKSRPWSIPILKYKY